jgi:gamma-glutamyl hydrolase
MAIWASTDGTHDVLSPLEAHGVSLPLEFTVQPELTKMFKDLPTAHIFEEYDITYNSHGWGLDPKKFDTDEGLASIFHATSISYSTDTHEPFVATMESTEYPFYGTQFHPEKTITMFNDKGSDHSVGSMMFNSYFAELFVDLARQNSNYPGDFADV